MRLQLIVRADQWATSTSYSDGDTGNIRLSSLKEINGLKANLMGTWGDI